MPASDADRLTGLPSWRDVAAALAGATPLALVVDVDGLIWVNDQLGFEAGDRALREIAAELKRMFERGIFRIGGEEFLVLLPMGGPRRARDLAAEIVRRVRALSLPYRRTNRPEQQWVEVNVVLVRLTTRLVKDPRFPSGLRDRVAQAIYDERRKGTPAGFVADAL